MGETRPNVSVMTLGLVFSVHDDTTTHKAPLYFGKSFIIVLGVVVVATSYSRCGAWTIQVPPANTQLNGWRSITYGNGIFVAVSSGGVGNRVMTSPDGMWVLPPSLLLSGNCSAAQ